MVLGTEDSLDVSVSDDRITISNNIQTFTLIFTVWPRAVWHKEFDNGSEKVAEKINTTIDEGMLNDEQWSFQSIPFSTKFMNFPGRTHWRWEINNDCFGDE